MGAAQAQTNGAASPAKVELDAMWASLAGSPEPAAAAKAASRVAAAAIDAAKVLSAEASPEAVGSSLTHQASRQRYVASLAFEGVYKWKVDTKPGRVSIQGAVHARDGAAARQLMNDAGANDVSDVLLSARLRKMTAEGRLMSLFAKDGETKLAERRVTSFAHVRCDPCEGEGATACGNCARSCVEQCPQMNCNNGSVACFKCGGSMRVFDYATNRNVNCNQCFSGWHNCKTCGGDGRIRCRACAGRGTHQCGSCVGNGVVTAIHGHEVWIKHSFLFSKPDGVPDDVRAGFVSWIRRGAPGASAVHGDGLAPSSTHARAVVMPDPSGRLRCSFVAAVTSVSVKGTMGATDFYGRLCAVGSDSIAFSPFLDGPARKLAAAVEALPASASPADVLEALSGARVFRDRVRDRMQSGNAPDSIRNGLVTSESKGAVPEVHLRRIAGVVDRCLANLSRAALKRAWKVPLAAAAALASATLLFDVPGYFAKTLVASGGVPPIVPLVIFAAAAFPVAAACRAWAWGSARRLMKDEAGVEAKEMPKGWWVRTAPSVLAGALVAAAAFGSVSTSLERSPTAASSALTSARGLLGITPLRP